MEEPRRSMADTNVEPSGSFVHTDDLADSMIEDSTSSEGPQAESGDKCEDSKQIDDNMNGEPKSAEPSGSDVCPELMDDVLKEEDISTEDHQAKTWKTLQIESATVKFFSKVPGGFQKHIQGFLLNVKNSHFTEVPSCDLNFCPHSEAGPCIEAICKETPAGKSSILAMMHHTEDPAYVVPDSSSYIKDLRNIHIVDFLYSEHTGLLKCAKNDEAHNKFMEILTRLEWDLLDDAKEADCDSVRVHKVIPRSVRKHINPFKICLDESPNMTQVDSSEWSDVTLAFCPIVSRVGTDIEAALKDIEDSKPGILVAMHHTFDQEYVIPDTSRFGRNKDVLIVDCLFHEDQGLFACKTNQEALEQIKRRLDEEQKRKTVNSSSPLTVGSRDYTRSYSLAKIKQLINFFSKMLVWETPQCPLEPSAQQSLMPM